MLSRIAILSLAVGSSALAGGCATRFREPPESAPHATLIFPSQGYGAPVGVVLEPVEINDQARPQALVFERLRIPPGELRLLARAAEDNLHGTCLLRFPAVAGEAYEVDARSIDDAFAIRVVHNGLALSECRGTRQLSPTPRRLPGIDQPHS